MPTSDRRAELVVGVISDTHDHLYPEVKALLKGVDQIIHAGDVCSPAILAELRSLAPLPLIVVRGNCDVGAWAADIPVRAEFELGGRRILVGHVGTALRREAVTRAARPVGTAGDGGSAMIGAADPVDIVIFGHSHQALVEQKDGVLHLNPGAAGPRRYGRPRTMAFLRIPLGGAAPRADVVVVEA